MKMQRFDKTFQFKAASATEETRNGIRIGIVKGYGLTWEVDRSEDQLLKGSTTKSLERHRADGRQIRMKSQHNKLIGGFPIEKVREDDNGVWLEGEINLEVQEGWEAYALAKQGVLLDMSVGFGAQRKNISTKTVDGKTVTQFKEIEIWEFSLVDEPANKNAKVVMVKSFDSLPIAARDVEFNSDFSNYSDEQKEKAFLVNSKELPIANLIDGIMTIIPKAVFRSAATLLGIYGSLAISDDEFAKSEKTIMQIYKKMNLDSPFDKDGIDITLIESCISQKDVEQLLKFAGISDDGRKILTNRIKSFSREGVDEGIVKSLKTNADELGKIAQGILDKTLST